MTHAPPNWVFSLFSFTGFILCCIPFPWHLAAWNTGTCLYMAWTGVMCLILFINSIVWNGNDINWAPIWCDISARMYIGIGVAVPATSLCIARRLYKIAAVRNVIITKAEKRRAVMIDLAIGVGLPVLAMILQYIPQGHRFNIFEDVGCFPFTYNTPVGIVLVSVPPILIGWITAIYAVMGVMAFNKSRKQYNEFLSGHLTNHRYVRLMCLAGFGSFCTIILGTYVLVRNCTVDPIEPWRGWADTHADFSRVDQFPAIVWRYAPNGTEASLELARWLTVLCAFTFFAFFGFAEEARRHYQTAAQSIAKRVGVSSTGTFGSTLFSSTGSKSKHGIMSTGNGATLPVFIHNHTTRKVDDLDSISDMSVSIHDAGGVLGDEKEKSFSPDVSYGALSLADVGGVLPDYKADPYSPTPTSGASSASSLSSPAVPPAGLAAPSSHQRPDSTIEISSVRYLDVHERPLSYVVHEPTLSDASSEVRRNPQDMA